MRKVALVAVIVFCVIIAGLILAGGCGKNKGEEKALTVWHWMTDRDDVLQELAQKYENETGVKVKIDLYAPSDVYSKKITASAQARALPDIYGVLNKKEVFASYIKNGFVLDLTDAFKENDSAWKKSLFEKAVNTNRFASNNSYGVIPGIYGVPLDVTNIQMLYNKKLLKKAGYDNPPRTFEEFLKIAETLKMTGIGGFVSGWGEPWMSECFASNYAFNIMGEEKVMATIKGDVSYTDPDWIKVFNVFKDMRDSGVLLAGIVTKGNKFAEQDFALERAAFAFNGSWCVNVYGDMNPELDYAPMLPPAVNLSRPMSIWGGAGSSFVVNGRSKKKQEAIDFLKWLTSDKQQAYFAKATRNLPANKKALLSIDPVLSEFAKGAEYTTHPSVWEVNEDAKVSERITKGIQSIIIGDKTPQEVAEDVQAMKEKIMARKKRRKGN